MDTIKSSADISHLFSTGRRLKTPYLTLIIGEEGESPRASRHDLQGRVAFFWGEKRGHPGWRNTCKRRMREVCHALGGPWPGYDVIFLAKSSLTDASYSKVLKACDKAVAHSCLGAVEEKRG